MEQQKLTRRKLYDLVWSTPMTKLAPRFGISDVALRKRCHNHDIPTPGAGYWAQVAAGHDPEKDELPSAAPALEYICFEGKAGAPSEKPIAPIVDVSNKLVDPHPAVVWLDGALDEAAPDEYGRLSVGETYHPRAFVTRPLRDRALRLLDALFKALEGRGHEVEARMPIEHATEKAILLCVFDEELAVHVEEKLGKEPHALTTDERKEKEHWEKLGLTWNRGRKYDYFAAGELKIGFGRTHYKYQGRKSCYDTSTQRIEGQLGSFVLAIEAAAQLARHERLETERVELFGTLSTQLGPGSRSISEKRHAKPWGLWGAARPVRQFNRTSSFGNSWRERAGNFQIGCCTGLRAPRSSLVQSRTSRWRRRSTSCGFCETR